jgi:hypothetical protein
MRCGHRRDGRGVVEWRAMLRRAPACNAAKIVIRIEGCPMRDKSSS